MDMRYQDTRTKRCPVHLCPYRDGHEGTDYLVLNDNGRQHGSSLLARPAGFSKTNVVPVLDAVHKVFSRHSPHMAA